MIRMMHMLLASEASSGTGGGPIDSIAFSEDFWYDTSDAFDAYPEYARANYVIGGGTLTMTAGNTLFIRNDLPDFTDCAIEARVIDARGAGLVLRFVREDEFYLAEFWAGNGYWGSNGNGGVRIWRRKSGWNQIVADTPFPWPGGEARTVRFEATGSTITFRVDGEVVAEVEDALIPSGRLGVYCSVTGGSGNVFDTLSGTNDPQSIA